MISGNRASTYIAPMECSSGAEAIAAAAAVRARRKSLFSPGPDTGIDLRKGRAKPVKSRDRNLNFVPKPTPKPKAPPIPLSEITLSGSVQGHFPFMSPVVTRADRVENIQRAVALRYRLTQRDIVSERKTYDVAHPRQVAAWVCKKLLPAYSLPMIGRLFGGRDHTTILHSVRKVEKRLQSDEKLKDDVRAILCDLGVSPAEYLPA